MEANRQQIEVNKSEKAGQQADDQRKSVSDRNQAIKDSIKKTSISLKRSTELPDAAASDVDSVTVLLALSAIGAKRTSLFAPHMPAFGGKADMPFCAANVRF